MLQGSGIHLLESILNISKTIRKFLFNDVFTLYITLKRKGIGAFPDQGCEYFLLVSHACRYFLGYFIIHSFKTLYPPPVLSMKILRM